MDYSACRKLDSAQQVPNKREKNSMSNEKLSILGKGLVMIEVTRHQFLSYVQGAVAESAERVYRMHQKFSSLSNQANDLSNLHLSLPSLARWH